MWGGRLFEAGRLLTFSAFRMGAYSRWALIRGWSLIRINTVHILYLNTIWFKAQSLWGRVQLPCLDITFTFIRLYNLKIRIFTLYRIRQTRTCTKKAERGHSVSFLSPISTPERPTLLYSGWGNGRVIPVAVRRDRGLWERDCFLFVQSGRKCRPQWTAQGRKLVHAHPFQDVVLKQN